MSRAATFALRDRARAAARWQTRWQSRGTRRGLAAVPAHKANQNAFDAQIDQGLSLF